jgi:serine phosphatase RsbU (regulator of sigma subunit)/PAS domain-containing protein
MQQPREPHGLTDRVAGLKSRGEALRQAAALSDADLKPLLDAVLAEIDAAASALGDVQARDLSDVRSENALRAERRLLHAAFQQVPTGLFLVGQDGTIRRANIAATELLGAGPGYPTGKRFTALVDPASRAAVQSLLAASLRTAEPRELTCGVLAGDGLLTCDIAVRSVTVRGGDQQLMLAVTPQPAAAAADRARPVARSRQPDPVPDEAANRVLTTMTRRMDVVTAANRLLLENVTSSELALLQRMARLLADSTASWVLVDVRQGDRLRRKCVAGPDDQDAAARIQAAAAVDPPPDSVPGQVDSTGSAQLLPHSEDDSVLGVTNDGVPLLLLLRGGSVLCVPVAASGGCYGTLTLVRSGGQGPFGLADAGLAEEAAQQLARALTMHRVIERRTEAAEAFQESLLPADLRPVPGVVIATAHLPSSIGSDVGGDFYDVYQTPDGWGVAIGDVSGVGAGIPALSASARHAIRVLGHWTSDPAKVLQGANDILLAEHAEGRLVTANAAQLSWQDHRLQVLLGSAGHPGPVLIAADGRARLIEGGGVPLGLFPGGEVAVVERELELDIGDVLFLSTDGLTGARSPDLAQYGDRLASDLADLAGRTPAEMIAGIQARLAEFCDGVLLDDATMLAFQAAQAPG